MASSTAAHPTWTADIAGTLVVAKVGKSLVLRPK
jgi:hypothetical protein